MRHFAMIYHLNAKYISINITYVTNATISTLNIKTYFPAKNGGLHLE